MKAIVYKTYGPPDVLHLAEVEKPTPADNEVLVKVSTTTVTAGDTRMRSFNVPPSFWIPARLVLGLTGPRKPILGMEIAGRIESVGKEVTQFQPGDRVFASTLEHGFGGYAEYIALPADGVLARSGNLTDAEAVTLPVGARTALYFLRAADVQPGQKVLINGASGSVGTFAVQLAKHMGAEVTGVCSGTNAELVRSLGADRVIDYTQEDFTQEDFSQEDFSRRGELYDVIFDVVGKSAYGAMLRVLKEEGAYLSAVAAPDISLRMGWGSFTSRRTFVGGGPPPHAADLDELRELMELGVIQPVFDKGYRLEEMVEAHRYVDTGRKRGNVVISVGQEDVAREPGEPEHVIA